MPLNLLQLATPLREKGFDVQILDLHIEKPSNHELRKYLEKALLVGISAFTGLQSAEAIRFARIIRNIDSKIPIVWGGYHPSLWKELASKSELVDYVITGCGEKALSELALNFQNGELPSGKIIDGGLVENIPSPLMDLIKPEKYIARTLLAERVANINTSYGCPHQCSFCAVNKTFNRKWAAKHPEQVLDETEYLASRWAINGLEFSDNAPWVDKNRMMQIAQGFIQGGLKLSWMSMARADELNSLSVDEWRLLAASGFRRVFVGIETGDDRILKSMGKGENENDYLQFAENCAKHGVIPDYSFTLGYPPEPMEDIEKSFELIRKLKKMTPSGTVMLYRYTPYSPDSLNLSDYGFPSTWDQWAEYPWDSYSLTSAAHPWLEARHKRRIRDFETVMTCAYHREEGILPGRGKCSWLVGLLVPIAHMRWENRKYSSPWEIRVLRRTFLMMNRGSGRSGIAT